MRVLFLDGECGSVACRVHGALQQGTIPQFTQNGTSECATRTLLRMNNLVAVRGKPGEQLLGPVDYYGNIEDAHLYVYTIEIDSHNIPTIYAIRNGQDQQSTEAKPPPRNPSTIPCKWISGFDLDKYHKKLPPNMKLGWSLFPNPGLLLLQSSEFGTCYYSTESDLSQFKARLVKNNVPFSLVSHKLRPADEFRIVSYVYESGYAAAQMRNPDGGGLFLERHRFAQFITPLSPKCGGFVVLALLEKNVLIFIAVRIPFGWTLIVEEGAIHGDATLQGKFMMGMTSDHSSMQTADTVFLKALPDYRNVEIHTLIKEEAFSMDDLSEQARPIITARPSNTIFNPFSLGYWKSFFF